MIALIDEMISGYVGLSEIDSIYLGVDQVYPNPTIISGVTNTGLGWVARDSYLVYSQGTDLGTSNDRHFYKQYDGYAIAVYGIHRSSSNWYGPILISTEQYNTDTTQGEGYGVYTYRGYTWIANTGYHYSGASYTTPLIVWDCTGRTTQEIVSDILDVALVG